MTNSIIDKIHKSPYKLVCVSSGGGTDAISKLLKVPGASNTIIESYIPYSKKSMDLYLNKKPDYYCSLQTSLSMCGNAYNKCANIVKDSNISIGISITASLKTTYKKIL